MTLAAVLRKYERTPADTWLCLHFALEAAAACGRADLTGLLPQYGSAGQAFRALRSQGCASLIELLDAHATPIAPACARDGDPVYFDQAPIGAMGVAVGGEGVFLGAGRFVRRPLSDLLAWRLP